MNDVIDDQEACALQILEQRLGLLSINGRRVAKNEWKKISNGIIEFVPQWYVSLVQHYSVLGAVLEYRGLHDIPLRMFSFFGPDDLAVVLAEGGLGSSLLSYGYFPFANESDGNYWVCKLDEAYGAVYLLELSRWDRGEPTAKNGLMFGASRLSYLITSMGISEASYYGYPKGPSRVIWYREKL